MLAKTAGLSRGPARRTARRQSGGAPARHLAFAASPSFLPAQQGFWAGGLGA